MLKKQDYDFILYTLAPVHIGSGVKVTSKESIQENGEYYFENNNCDMCWYCIKLYVSCNDRFCRCWIVKGF